MSRVRVVVSEEQKQKWSDYAEETPEYDSVSDLVRKSVESEIHSEESEQSEYEELYEILETVESIEKKQARLADSVDAHRQNALTEDDLSELEHVVTEALWDFADTIRDVRGGRDEE